MLNEVLVDGKFPSNNRYFIELICSLYATAYDSVRSINPFFVNFHGTYGPLYKRKLPFFHFCDHYIRFYSEIFNEQDPSPVLKNVLNILLFDNNLYVKF